MFHAVKNRRTSRMVLEKMRMKAICWNTIFFITKLILVRWLPLIVQTPLVLYQFPLHFANFSGLIEGRELGRCSYILPKRIVDGKYIVKCRNYDVVLLNIYTPKGTANAVPQRFHLAVFPFCMYLTNNN